MLRISTCFNTCAKHDDSASRVMWTYKGELNSASRKNWKEPLTFAISTDVSLNVDSNEETLSVNKTKMDIKHL